MARTRSSSDDSRHAIPHVRSRLALSAIVTSHRSGKRADRYAWSRRTDNSSPASSLWTGMTISTSATWRGPDRGSVVSAVVMLMAASVRGRPQPILRRTLEFARSSGRKILSGFGDGTEPILRDRRHVGAMSTTLLPPVEVEPDGPEETNETDEPPGAPAAAGRRAVRFLRGRE